MSRGRGIVGRRASAWLLSMLLVLAVAVPAGAAAPVNAGSDLVAVFVGFEEAPGPAEHALVTRHRGSVTHSYELVPAVAAIMPRQALDGLARNPQVSYIEPVIEAFAIDHEGGGYGTELTATWGVERIGAGEAHHDGYTGSGVRVAVLDSGMAPHSDLSHDTACSWGTSYGTLNDGSSHGTHVAGTVAALRDGTGVVGVGPDVSLCIFKVLGDSGSGSFSDVIAALDWIAAFNGDDPSNPIRVTNNSYGASSDPGITVRGAFDALADEGVLHVAAAGNAGNPPGNGSNCIYPAIYDSVVAVAATDSSNRRASFSSTCAEVELSAPGVSIRSTMPGGAYGTKSGTSMASPHVAGAAALVFAAGATDASVVRAVLSGTAIGLAGGSSRTGAGLVQAHTAVRAVADPPPPAETGTITGTVTDDETVPVGIDGATVTVDGTTFTSTTDADGNYTISDVPTGTYSVTASKDGYSSVTRSSQSVTADAMVTVDFTLTPDSGSDEDPADFTLTVNPYKERGLQKADLSWTGVTADHVDVHRDGTVIATISGSPYTDNINQRGGGSYAYQVCEAGSTTVCSDVVIARF